MAVVPGYDSDFFDIASGLDICIAAMHPGSGGGESYQWPPRLGRVDVLSSARVLGRPRIIVTDLDVEMPAGTPSPRPLTPWKLAAVKLCLHGAGGAELTDADFAMPLRRRTFLDNGWIRLVRREGRSGVYVLEDRPGRPDLAYQEITAAIRKNGGA